MASRDRAALESAARKAVRPSDRRGDRVRLMTGNADWPRIELRYTFESRPEAKFSRDPLQYEKRMLGDWFSMRFAPR